MTTLAIRTTAWDALTDAQRRGLIEAAEVPVLGAPAAYVDDDGAVWNVHDDHRITDEQVALVAALMENPAAIPEPTDVEA